VIATFYSFKGGVGRSMALANVAELLASRGYRVIACDWDLEAPGLERYFAADRQQSARLTQRPGIVDLLLEYKQTLSEPAAEQERDNPRHFTVVNGIRLRRPSSYALDVPGSRVRLLTAGRRDGEAESRYNAAVQSFAWNEFYREWAGAAYLEFLRKDLDHADVADVVLVDSRTGVTEQGGVCTHHLADLVAIFAAPNDLNLEGAKWMVRALQNPELAKLRGGRALGMLPLASRVEVINEEGHLAGFEKRFADYFAQFVPGALGDQREFLRRAQIPYIPAFSFEERVVAREDAHKRNLLLYDAYNLITNAIVQWGTDAQLLTAREASRGAPSPTGALQVTQPFVGLRSMSEADAPVFQGRDDFVALLLDKLRANGVVVLAGDQGVGKTSLVRAGLIPAVRLGALNREPSNAPWPVTYIARPELADVRAHLDAPGLVVVDNVEDILDPTATEQTFQTWLDLLEKLPWAAAPADRRVLLVVRRAEMTQLSRHPRLASLIQANTVVLPPLDVQHWSEAVQTRLQVSGLRMETGLLEAVLTDFGNSRNIPLLELTLLRLWERRRGAVLTHEAYYALNGFKGLVGTHAEEAWSQLATDDQELAKKVLLRLVQPGEGSEDLPRTAGIDELLSLGSVSAVEHVLRALADKWLVTASESATGGRTIDIGHPVLLRDWPRLRVWINENREDLRVLRRLQASAQAWWDAGRPTSRLLGSERLREARAIIARRPEDVRPIEVKFVRDSQRSDRRATLLAGSFGALIFAGIIGYQIFLRAPEPYVNAVKEPFLVTPTGKPDAGLWDYPASWHIVSGEGTTPEDGALIVEGSSIGLLKAKNIYDFDASFKVRILAGSKAAWAFRIQSNRQRYYLFELERKNARVQANGKLVGTDGASILTGGTQLMPAEGCCREDDAFRVDAKIQGNEFRFVVTVDPASGGTGDFAPYYGQAVHLEPMRDPAGKYRYGGVGFLTDNGGQMRVEYFELSNLRRQDR
jgi:cellulose biosynthesis protein BcsQ